MAKKTIVAEAEKMIKPTELANVSAEPTNETPEPRKPKVVKKIRKGKKSEALAKTPPKKPVRKPAKPKAKKAAKPGLRKVIEAKAEKPTGRKPGPKKKVAEKPTKAITAKAKKKPGRKPGKKPARKPGKKAAALVPVSGGRKLTARRADVIRKGQQALEFFLDQQRQIDEMAQVIATYERVFEAVRGLFSREMEEIEELVAGLLE